MAIFITGAAGFIGGSLAHRLLRDGRSVRGLVRGSDKAEQLARLGVAPVVGDLDDRALLAREAASSDGVINAASSDHRPAVEAILDGLAGSGKPFLHTSGSSVIADNAKGEHASDRVFEDDTPFEPAPEKAQRAAIDQLVRDGAARGVRSVVLCNTMIYGVGLGLSPDSVQIPAMVRQARESGVVRHVGSGRNIWSNVHLDDVLDLYVAAFERAPAGAFYFVENGEASFHAIGEAIADALGLGAPQAWTVEQAAAAWGGIHAAYSFGSNSRVSGRRARAELGWAPRHRSVTEWIRATITPLRSETIAG
jgi:nucleoside-diphosphate-sugar epimerase